MMPPLNSLSAQLSAWTLATVAATTLLTAISTPVFAQTSSPAISLSPAVEQTTQTTPVNGNFIAPANVSLTATATAASGSSINQVQFYQGNTLIGTSNNPTTPNSNSYSIAWSNVPTNSYVVTAKATDSLGNTSTSAPATVNVINNNPPAVSLTASPSKAVVPATILLNATASDSDGSISKVDVLNGNNLIASLTQPPYSTQWTNVAAGTYSLTATATDNLGATTTSAPVSVTVAGSAAQVYDIHTDQLNTPRVITDKNGNAVWRWDSAPFGESLPDENPMHSGAENDFRFNLRFPGQYYDDETGLHYNYFRDYDPTTGRYVQSDPIGLQGGINTYGYANLNPLAYIDPSGEMGIVPAACLVVTSVYFVYKYPLVSG